jgi:hypothetical protein
MTAECGSGEVVRMRRMERGEDEIEFWEGHVLLLVRFLYTILYPHSRHRMGSLGLMSFSAAHAAEIGQIAFDLIQVWGGAQS